MSRTGMGCDVAVSHVFVSLSGHLVDAGVPGYLKQRALGQTQCGGFSCPDLLTVQEPPPPKKAAALIDTHRRETPRSGCRRPAAARCTGLSVRSAPRICRKGQTSWVLQDAKQGWLGVKHSACGQGSSALTTQQPKGLVHTSMPCMLAQVRNRKSMTCKCMCRSSRGEGTTRPSAKY